MAKKLRYGKFKKFNTGTTSHNLSTGRLGADTVIDGDVIKDVAVISIGEAKGHNIFIDTTTLTQVADLGNAAPQGVKVKLDHSGGVKDIVGRVKNFRVAGDKVIADLHLLKSHPMRGYVLELAAEMPAECGLSVSINGADEEVGGKIFARATEMDSVDLVTEPAANQSGLFNKKENVDKTASDNKTFETMTPDEIKQLMTDALAPIATGFAKLQEDVAGLKSQYEAATAATGTDLAATAATGTDLGATGTESSDEKAMSAVVNALGKLFATAGIKAPANPTQASTPATPVEKTFEELVIEARKAGKKLTEAVEAVRKENAKAFDAYLGRCKADSEAETKSKEFGVPFTATVNRKAFASNLN